MKRKCFLLAVSLAAGTNAMAGDTAAIASAEADSVYNSLAAGNWPDAEKLSSRLISKNSPAQNNLIARMRYIYLFSIYKQLENKQLSYEAFKRKIRLVLKKEIIQPWHPIKSGSDACFNYICNGDNKTTELRTVQTNDHGTQIYSFEYYDIGYPLNIASYDGQNARLGGILAKIDINRNLQPAMAHKTAVTWYLRLYFKHGYIQYER